MEQLDPTAPFCCCLVWEGGGGRGMFGFITLELEGGFLTKELRCDNVNIRLLVASQPLHWIVYGQLVIS